MPDFIACLDLGQTSDPTALAVLKRSMVIKDGKPLRSNKGGILSRFAVVHLQRFPLGTSYPDIVTSVGRMLADSRLRPFRPRLAVDATGVGRAVMDMFIPELSRTIDDGQPILPLTDLYPITITAGDKWSAHSYSPGVVGFHVPKIELASTVQAGLGSGRLEFGRLPDKYQLEQAKAELKAFQIKTTKAANQTFAAREGAHDDIVLAIACGMWVGSLPRISHRSAVAFAEIEDRAAASGKPMDEVLKELRATADAETLSLIDEHTAETQAMKAEADEEAKRRDREWRNPSNPHWWQ